MILKPSPVATKGPGWPIRRGSCAPPASAGDSRGVAPRGRAACSP